MNSVGHGRFVKKNSPIQTPRSAYSIPDKIVVLGASRPLWPLWPFSCNRDEEMGGGGGGRHVVWRVGGLGAGSGSAHVRQAEGIQGSILMDVSCPAAWYEADVSVNRESRGLCGTGRQGTC